ncbi:MAG TPA: ABC transporter permease [Patescibacteria group bacterium]|nr:ABC transporter permease [Patescibacteria group bacterium]
MIEYLRKEIKKQLPFFFAAPAVLCTLFMLCVPVLVLYYRSFFNDTVPGLTFINYTHFYDILYAKVIGRSLLFALGTTFGTLLLGYPVAYFIAFYTKKSKFLFIFLLTLPFWTNIIVQVYAWFFILEKEGFLNTSLLYLGIINEPIKILYSTWATLIVMIYCYLPFMIIPLYNALEKIDQKLLEASRDLGATHWETLKQITIPLSANGIRTGIILVFVPSFGEFVIPALIGGSKFVSVGSLISFYYIEMYNEQLGATFTIIASIVLILSVLCLYQCINYYFKRRSSNEFEGSI